MTAALVEALAGFGRVTLCLNRNQHQGVLYRRALGALDPAVEVVEAFDSIAALLAAVASFDYAVFADSGSAHMAKLFGTPGVAVFTSAPGEVLQGRFTNPTRWSVRCVGRLRDLSRELAPFVVRDLEERLRRPGRSTSAGAPGIPPATNTPRAGSSARHGGRVRLACAPSPGMGRSAR